MKQGARSIFVSFSELPSKYCPTPGEGFPGLLGFRGWWWWLGGSRLWLWAEEFVGGGASWRFKWLLALPSGFPPIVRSSGSSSMSLLMSPSPPRASSFMSLRRVPPVGEALARSSDGEIFTPALANSLEASSGSKGLGIGSTGRSLVEIPRCWRDMCECSEFLDLATVPQSTQRYPGQTVCLSSKWVRSVWADR